jgi:GNAT superfamily N-acetyltransferase
MPGMYELERISVAAYLPVYGADAAHVAGATCLRAPLAPDSPMMNRVVGLGVAGGVDEAEVDDALAAMGDTTFYVAVSPDADPRLDELLAVRGLEPGWGWMVFERGPIEPPDAAGTPTVVDVDASSTAAWAEVVLEAYGLPPECAPMIEAVPSTTGWHAFLALAGDAPAAAAAIWIDAPNAYLGFAGTRPEHRGKGGQGALFAARIARALEAGCTRLVTETGERRDDRPSSSYRNILRYGFEERFVVAHRLRRRAS